MDAFYQLRMGAENQGALALVIFLFLPDVDRNICQAPNKHQIVPGVRRRSRFIFGVCSGHAAAAYLLFDRS